jgi:hypothetical protein
MSRGKYKLKPEVLIEFLGLFCYWSEADYKEIYVDSRNRIKTYRKLLGSLYVRSPF